MTPQQGTVAAIIDDAPVRRIDYRLWLLATGGTLIDGMAVFTLGVAMPLIIAGFGIEPHVQGLLAAALVFGAVAGAVIGGPAADRLGRRPMMLLDMAIIITGAVISALANDATTLIAGQLLVGIGVGIDFPVSASYVAEWMPRQIRSRMMVATIAFQSVGFIVAAALCLMLVSISDSKALWRWFFFGEATAAALFLLGRFGLPESARWLASAGRMAEARAALARVIAVTGNWSGEVAASMPADSGVSGYGVLFSRSYRKRTALAALPWFLMDIATYGMGLFTPVILAAIHFGKSDGGTIAAEAVDIKGSGAIDLFLLIGFVIGLYVVPRFGRVRMQVVGFLGMAAAMGILFMTVQIQGEDWAKTAWIFAAFVLFNLAMNAGPNSTTFAMPSALFPTALRASANGLAAAVAKLGATLSVFLLPIVKADWGVPVVLGLMAAVSVLGAASTAILNEEIDDSALP
jgi:MFS transporter, putative metabolite transport protein